MSTVLDEIEATLVTEFRDLIEVPEAVAVQYDNQADNRPADTRWIRYRVLPSEARFTREVGLGPSEYRRPGVSKVGVYEPIHEGTGPLVLLCGKIEAAFEARSVLVSAAVTLTYQTPSTVHRGRAEDGAYWLSVVTIPWTAAESR